MRRIGLVGLVCWSLLGLLHAQRLIVPSDDGLADYMGRGPMLLSPNGQVLLGSFHTRITWRHHPAIWTLQDGWWYLKRDGSLTRNPREAIWGYPTAISYDGSVVLGFDLATGRSFRWRRGQPIEYLRRPARAYRDRGAFLSWDGGWVGGEVVFPLPGGEYWQPARWSPEGRVELIEDDFNPMDMSASGREMVGDYHYIYACHWREGEGLRLYWAPFTWATCVSADGTIAVGSFVDRYTMRRCIGRWFVDEDYEDCAIYYSELPTGYYGLVVAEITDTSADARVIVGYYIDSVRGYGFLWEEGRGWVNIEEAYGWLFGENRVEGASYISADGRYVIVTIVGYSLWADAILDRFGIQGDVTGDDCVDDADLLRLLFAFGKEGWCPEDVNADWVVDEQDLLIVLLRFGECVD